MIDKLFTQTLIKLGWRYRIIDKNILYLLDYRAVLDINVGISHSYKIYYGDSMYEFVSPGYYVEEYNNLEHLAHHLQYMMRDLILRENKL